MHTSLSDGQRSPEEAYRIYRKHGYDFVFRTDHWQVGGVEKAGGLLVLPGCEYNVGGNVRDGVYHILYLGSDKELPVERTSTAQEIIDAIHTAGGLAGLAHPAWSLNTPEQIRALRGIDFTEIYNSVSGYPRNCRPDSSAIVDLMAANGLFLPLVAGDDTHFYNEYDTCVSFNWVQADSCTPEAILDAMCAGRCIASQGPFLEAQLDGDTLIVDSTPVEQYIYYTDSVWEEHRIDRGHGLTHSEFHIHGGRTFVRVEAIDADGKRAWSQYFKL